MSSETPKGTPISKLRTPISTLETPTNETPSDAASEESKYVTPPNLRREEDFKDPMTERASILVPAFYEEYKERARYSNPFEMRAQMNGGQNCGLYCAMFISNLKGWKTKDLSTEICLETGLTSAETVRDKFLIGIIPDEQEQFIKFEVTKKVKYNTPEFVKILKQVSPDQPLLQAISDHRPYGLSKDRQTRIGVKNHWIVVFQIDIQEPFTESIVSVFDPADSKIYKPKVKSFMKIWNEDSGEQSLQISDSRKAILEFFENKTRVSEELSNIFENLDNTPLPELEIFAKSYSRTEGEGKNPHSFTGDMGTVVKQPRTVARAQSGAPRTVARGGSALKYEASPVQNLQKVLNFVNDEESQSKPTKSRMFSRSTRR